MTRMSLTTFLGTDCLDSVARTTKLEQYAEPGGGDYYMSAKLALGKIFHEDKPFDQAIGETMMNLSNSTRRQDNYDAVRAMYDWKRDHSGTYLEPPTGEFAGPQGELIVVMRPAFARRHKGITTAYVPWMFKELRLTSRVASMGIHLMDLILKKDDFSGWRFAMIDTVTGETFTRTHKNSSAAVMATLKIQEECIIEHKNRKSA